MDGGHAPSPLLLLRLAKKRGGTAEPLLFFFSRRSPRFRGGDFKGLLGEALRPGWTRQLSVWQGRSPEEVLQAETA